MKMIILKISFVEIVLVPNFYFCPNYTRARNYFYDILITFHHLNGSQTLNMTKSEKIKLSAIFGLLGPVAGPQGPF